VLGAGSQIDLQKQESADLNGSQPEPVKQTVQLSPLNE
jgi:hypothetical protein